VVSYLVDWLIGLLDGYLVIWLANLLVIWLVIWLIGFLVALLVGYSEIHLISWSVSESVSKLVLLFCYFVCYQAKGFLPCELQRITTAILAQ